MKFLTSSWWITLFQGIIMIALSVMILRNPVTVLTTLAMWVGLLVFLGGIAGILSYVFTRKENRSTIFLITGIITFLLGGAMLTNLGTTERIMSMLFGVAFAMIGAMLLYDAWRAQKHWSSWWIAGMLGLGAVVIGIASIFRTSSGASAISLFLGISTMSSGIGLIILAFVKRNIVHAIKNAVDRK